MMLERLAEKNPGGLSDRSLCHALVFVTTKGRKEARRRSPGDFGVYSSGVVAIAAARKSILSALRGATINCPTR